MVKAAVALVAVGFAAGVGWQAPAEVPFSLLEAAAGAPVDFVVALAKASVPAGIEVRLSDNPPPADPSLITPAKGTISVSEVLKAFDASHREYRYQEGPWTEVGR